MPVAPLQFCRTPGCPIRVTRGHCAKHKRQKDLARGTKQERGYDRRWELYSQERLADHPYCVGYPHGYHGTKTILAEVTDHIVSAKARPDLFTDPNTINNIAIYFSCSNLLG